MTARAPTVDRFLAEVRSPTSRRFLESLLRYTGRDLRRRVLARLVVERTGATQVRKRRPTVVPGAPRGRPPDFKALPVVVRIDGRPSRLALLVDAPSPGFYVVRLSRGGGFIDWKVRPSRYFSTKSHRILAEEIIREATSREIQLGYVAPDLVGAKTAEGAST